MARRPLRFALRTLQLFALCALPFGAHAQSATATLSGTILDENGGAVPGTQITVLNVATSMKRETTTNDSGSFTVPLLTPGSYSIKVEHDGFKVVEVRDIVLNVGDERSLRIQMKVGDVKEVVDVTGEAPLINESAGVGTVVDREFVGNLPMNGRSFQSLITLAPGVVLTPVTSNGNQGQFSINGQRPDANYFTVDGVSANFGINSGSSGLGQFPGGALPAFSALGGTNSLVSIDAMQEFRIQTSSFAPEFGRMPGGQVSIVTRSGTNDFHGTVFDYLRNDALDANDWFANRGGQPKPRERQNDFGGVVGGHLVKDRTFFFFSYEGLRLRQPISTVRSVPNLTSRQTAIVALRPLLNAFPLANGADLGNGFAQLNATYSNPSTLDAYSIRLDHNLTNKLNVFARYNCSPSETDNRGNGLFTPSVLGHYQVKVHTFTLGLTHLITNQLTNEIRANYSNERAGNFFTLDSYGGAVPFTDGQLPYPSGISSQTAEFLLAVTSASLAVGKTGVSEQRQVNLIDNLSLAKGTHQFKFGVDFRWGSPISGPLAYMYTATFTGMTGANGAIGGKALSNSVAALQETSFLVKNFSLYGQDTWKVSPRLTLTYGLRWDVNPAMKGKSAASDPFAVQGIENPASMTLAPSGTALYRTRYGNFAPRVGAAYRLRQSSAHPIILRGGLGLFYDLGYGNLGQLATSWPFRVAKSFTQSLYPLSAAQAIPPAFSPNPPVTPFITADPNLKVPRTWQWNFAIEQGLGTNQTFTLTYVGAVGRDLLRQDSLSAPNATFTSSVIITRNTATSDYHALQGQFQRRLSRGLQALASYTWAHSIDIASDDFTFANTTAAIGTKLDRGNSDFDIRHTLTAALSYDIPSPIRKKVVQTVLGSWSLDNQLTVRSAPPVTPLGTTVIINGTAYAPRPNLVPGVPVYLFGPQYAGGKILNKAAFANPLAGQQGNVGRNVLRAFGAWQDDFTLRRQFHLTEKVGLQFRAEFFNIFNHPNFANFNNTLSSGLFGQSTQMLAQSLGAGGVNGGFNPLYQIGGPRSIQFAMKLTF